MWIFTTFGFFSIVQKKGTRNLTVRSRVRADLEALQSRCGPAAGPIQDGAGTDYPYRFSVDHEVLSTALADAVRHIDYHNYKSRVHEAQGSARARAYGKVWSALYKLEANEGAVTTTTRELKRAYGGVVVDADGRVLLRRPRGGYGGYAWTFGKGRPSGDETEEDCARREVEEECGCDVRIVTPIPGTFEGGTTLNRYWLMAAESEPSLRRCDSETEDLRWASPDEARSLIRMTREPQGRKRDLAVLEAALQVWTAGADE